MSTFLNSTCCRTKRGILNLECVVLPPGNNKNAIPDEATTSTIRPSDQILYIITCQRNVFPVPP